ncbi:UDP-N-acetylmuramate--L-alanine ligase [Olivibacter ginsenosidimutans]|uniref:UDP-N-acetylmuramate--L-alanine ligase n=1 Tax=Olivibacter ginsenosidimutans TaxID=1176537 RepID=A0ABP9BYB9_9SPHI
MNKLKRVEMIIEDLKQVFLIGIGGIGMSALARYFNHFNVPVAGYDKTETALTRQLTNEGISVYYDDAVEHVAFAFTYPQQDYLIIYTPAVPNDLAILRFFRELDCRLYKRSEVLGIISNRCHTIAIAGTHGKTTTSSMIAHLLTHSGYGCSAFLGGIAANYNTNVLFSSNQTLVVEADEYDRSFLTLYPSIAVVTSMDADHLDIYGDQSHLVESFRLFIDQVATTGIRIVKAGLTLPADIHYSIVDKADVYADNIHIIDGMFHFEYHAMDITIKGIKLGIAGRHNIENAVAAITAVRALGITEDAIKEALASFKGVKRRFEFIVCQEDCVYIDDYAHHPVELEACLSAVKELYNGKTLTCIFQPHLFSRTRDFADEFAQALAQADIVILMDIYPAREEPIVGIDAEWLLLKIDVERKYKLSNAEILDYIRNERPEVLVTVGAGNIDLLVEPIKEILENVE